MLPCGPYKAFSASPFLALELFDNTEFDPRTPADWMALGQFQGVNAGVPAKALLLDVTGALQWTDSLVMSYDAARSVFTVKAPSQADQQLPRLLILFKGEDPSVFAHRISDACQRRLQVESELMYNLYVDCMPRDDTMRPDDASYKHMAQFALGKNHASAPAFVANPSHHGRCS